MEVEKWGRSPSTSFTLHIKHSSIAKRSDNAFPRGAKTRPASDDCFKLD